MRFYLSFIAVIVLSLNACGRSMDRSGIHDGTSWRDPGRAEALTNQASELLQSDPHQAQALLRQAIEADQFFGPARNNLGVLLLNDGDLYGAAEEFDRARKLMPGHPDPRLNLGLALERGGKLEEALEAYASAIEVFPDHLPALQALAKLQVRSGRVDDSTQPMLQTIRVRGDPAWSRWAREQLIRLGHH